MTRAWISIGKLATGRQSPYFGVVFAVLEHSVLERKYAPLFQADFVLLLLRGGQSLFVLRIVRLLVATLHVGMTGKQDGGYTQLA